MIAKVCKRGHSASSLVRYLVGHGKTDHLVIECMDAVRLNAPSSIRPDIEKPIWHCALSLPADERMEAVRWRDVAEDFMRRMGLEGHEWSAVVHNETGHQHMHLVANRINYQGWVWTGEFDAKRAIAAAKAIELDHGLIVEVHKPTGRAALSQPEIERALRLETQPVKITLQEAIDRATVGRPQTAIFLARLEATGVQVLPNISQSTGRVSGMAFGYSGEIYKGSQLGKAYSWGQLQTRMDYEQDRDSPAIQDRAGRGSRGSAEGAGASGCYGSRDGRTGALDAHCNEQNVRSDAWNRTAGEVEQRLPERHSKGDSRYRWADVRDSAGMGANSGQNAPATSRPISTIARNRGPVCGSRCRISRLAESLLARIEQPPERAPSHDRHRPASRPNHQQVASVPGRERER